mmetsp:Transcript_9408/g.24155  ORF Transcript_9408/g.24155 Transcript_9408/m.24155 type:complete len:360 (+) Transcript_9408:392-1471(+)
MSKVDRDWEPQHGDIVWAKLDAFPWWPAQIIPLELGKVINVPDAAAEYKTYLEQSGGGSAGKKRKRPQENIHFVYFFGDGSWDFMPSGCLKKFDMSKESGMQEVARDTLNDEDGKTGKEFLKALNEATETISRRKGVVKQEGMKVLDIYKYMKKKNVQSTSRSTKAVPPVAKQASVPGHKGQGKPHERQSPASAELSVPRVVSNIEDYKALMMHFLLSRKGNRATCHELNVLPKPSAKDKHKKLLEQFPTLFELQSFQGGFVVSLTNFGQRIAVGEPAREQHSKHSDAWLKQGENKTEKQLNSCRELVEILCKAFPDMRSIDKLKAIQTKTSLPPCQSRLAAIALGLAQALNDREVIKC